MKTLCCVKPSYLLAGLLLGGRCAMAQAVVPAPVPPQPTSFKSGSYLLRGNTTWQSAKLLYNEQALLVSDADHKPKEPLTILADQVGLFVIGRDTFEVAHNVALPRLAQPLPLAFVRRLYRGGGYQVAEYVAYPPKPEPAVAYKLLYQQPAVVAAVLPPGSRQFRMALAGVVRDYVPLARQLELDPNIMPEQLPELLAAYGRWRVSQPANAQGK